MSAAAGDAATAHNGAAPQRHSTALHDFRQRNRRKMLSGALLAGTGDLADVADPDESSSSSEDEDGEALTKVRGGWRPARSSPRNGPWVGQSAPAQTARCSRSVAAAAEAWQQQQQQQAVAGVRLR